MKTTRKYVDLNAAVAPLKPSRRELLRLNWTMKSVGWFGRLLLRRYVKKMEVLGLEHLQAKGPFLILMNHTSPFDPMLLSFFGGTAAQFLVTEPFMAERRASRLAAWLGQIPKRKLDPDTRAMRTMKEWCKNGGKVAVFPEGQFSWCGTPSTLQSGLKELVNYLEVPVVTVRVLNGDRLWPAWAVHPRKTSLRMEIDPPKFFSNGEDIESYVAQKILISPSVEKQWPAEGDNLAEGLAKFFHFCFSCFEAGTLRDTGNELACSACGKSWQVSGDHRLQGESGSTSVAETWKKVRDHLSETWKENVSFRSSGTVSVLDATKAQWVTLAEGQLALSEEVLSVGDWQLDVKNILAHTLDWGDLILIRTERGRLAIRFPEDSRAVWEFALNEAWKRARG